MNQYEKTTPRFSKESLCIPRIESTIKREFIFKKLCMLKIGYIQKMTEIPLKNNPNFKRILVRIQWNDSEKANKFKEILNQVGSVNFVYDMPWFWKISYSL
jgi:hypothetical protein